MIVGSEVKKGDIVSAVGLLGEVVGRFVEETDTEVVLKSGRVFVPSQGESQGGFVASVGMTCRQDLNEVRLNKSLIFTVVPTHEVIEKGWIQAESGIVV